MVITSGGWRQGAAVLTTYVSSFFSCVISFERNTHLGNHPGSSCLFCISQEIDFSLIRTWKCTGISTLMTIQSPSLVLPARKQTSVNGIQNQRCCVTGGSKPPGREPCCEGQVGFCASGRGRKHGSSQRGPREERGAGEGPQEEVFQSGSNSSPCQPGGLLPGAHTLRRKPGQPSPAGAIKSGAWPRGHGLTLRNPGARLCQPCPRRPLARHGR